MKLVRIWACFDKKSYFMNLVLMLSGLLKEEEFWFGITDLANSVNNMLKFFNLLFKELIFLSFYSNSALSAFWSYRCYITSKSTFLFNMSSKLSSHKNF